MNFKPYPLYVSCDIHWFNEIPQNWKEVRVEQYLIKKDENIGDLWSSTQLLSLTQKGIIEKDINDGKGKTHSDYSTYQAVDIGDLVFCLFDIDETPRTVGLSTKKGMITSAYTAFKSKENINTQYLYYFFESLDDAKALKPYYKGLRKTVRPPEFLKIHVPFPPKVEQDVISKFLDNETARIDNLIAKQEKLIELLEEQRKSIISHAVTKGLNPNAPMKDSGVEWLGEVPEHWEVTFIKYITKKISSGKTPLGGAEVYTDEGVIFLRSQNIYSDGLHLDDVSFIPHEIHASMKSSVVKKNDVLLNITGGSIGRTCLVDREIGEANVNQHVCIIRTSKDKYAKLLSVFMKSNSAQSQIFYSQTGAGREGLNFSQIGNMRLPFPPFVEQQEILDFLDQENLRFDNLISKQKALIEKLKEYRASIISHAVTGKIDVREFGA
jgi:type I restriction enzyme, S subunit